MALFDLDDHRLPQPIDALLQTQPELSDEPFGASLSDLMGRRRITQSELARRAGISQTHVSRVVNGHSCASVTVTEVMAKALGVSPAYFLDYRLELTMRVIERSPRLLNELFEKLLSPAEHRVWKSLMRSDRCLGQTLSALSDQQGITLRELAADAELAPGSLEHLVASKKSVRSPQVLEVLASALDVPPEYFLEYRSALLREWLREDPPRLNALFEQLCSASSGSRASLVGAQLALSPHVAWSIRPVPDPRVAARSELRREIVRIVRVEGPVIGTRVYSLYARGAELRRITRAVRSRLNRAVADAVRRGLLLAENETGTDTQKDLVLRIPGTPRVVPRRRGERQLREIPPGELRWTIARVRELADAHDAVCRHVLALYDMDAASERERQHLERLMGRESR